MFAVLALDREPMKWADLPAALADWTKGAGGVAAAALAIWCVAYFLGRRLSVRVAGVEMTTQDAHPTLRGGGAWSAASLAFAGLVLVAAVCYVVAGLIWLAVQVEIPLGAWSGSALSILLIAAGGCAIAAVLLPMLTQELGRLSPRRIWALARLSLKEAFRKHIVWAIFSVMALIFLFAAWFIPYKPEDQLRNYVFVVYLSLALLFLPVACWLGAFGIPTEVKNQSIHTIVTKPVERFEIVLGRFLGYAILLSVVLFALGGISLLYIWRGVSAQAQKESYTARVPIYADDLEFYGTKDKRKGEHVGRMWEYRSYINGKNPALPQAPREYAVWSFLDLPTYSADGSDPVYVEFSFDIYRLTKGKEDRGVVANFTFADGSLSDDRVQKRLDEFKQERSKRLEGISKQADEKRARGEAAQAITDWQNAQQAQINADLIARFGVLEFSEEVQDYHTQALGGDDAEQRKRVGLQLARLFQSLNKEKPQARQGDRPVPALNVLVSVDDQRASAAQKLGVAQRDLYIRADSGPFWLNFLKGIIGIWFTVMIVLGIAVTCSTYFSAVISLLVTFFLLLFGVFRGEFNELVQGKAGGPVESAWQIFGKRPGVMRLDEVQGAGVIRGLDETYRFFVRLVLNVFPDVSRYDLHPYVANGFDISWSQVLLLDNLVPLVGYILPCAVLAFYLMRFREIANPT
jgi:hypothetical protein